MPSLQHEILVELFRSRAELAPTLLRLCAGIELAGTQAELGAADLSQVTPTEYRADATVVMRDDAGEPTSAVIVEVQLQPDADKRLVWPVYVAALRARLGCPVVLLVVAPDRAVAAWARAAIDLGHPGFRLTPLVIEDATTPHVADSSLATRIPQLAVLASLAHRDLASVQLLLGVIYDLPEGPRTLYLDYLFTLLPDDLLATLENPMSHDLQRRQDLQRRVQRVLEYRARKRPGLLVLRQALQEDLPAAWQEVRQALADTVLPLLRDKVGEVDAATEAHIRTQPVTVLQQLVLELARARDATEARAAIDRLGT